MHIGKLQLHRFKQFKSSDIELKPQLSLLVGGNNSGKSTILHSLAIWEFCKTILEYSRGRNSWIAGGGGFSQGVGIGISEFSPINVPSLKHLWNNLKTQKIHEQNGYSLKVSASWEANGDMKTLEFGLSLANDRLFIKNTHSNLITADVLTGNGDPTTGIVPKVAFLPPFAGITDQESRHSQAMRSRLIGQGLSGGVIRNMLYDMWLHNRNERIRLKDGKTKIRSSDLAALRENDPWEILLRTLGLVFSLGLSVKEFDDRYHTFLDIQTFRGEMNGQTLKKHNDDAARDLMVEGSGFLQWLSVYALALTPDVDIVLLDEPDAHLHCALQQELVNHLSQLALKKNKQVIMATHSTELIKSFDHRNICQVSKEKARYLVEQEQKIGLLAGIGTKFSPKLHDLAQKQKMLIVENDIDERLIKAWATTLGIEWPENLVTWLWSGGHKERRQLFTQLKKEIPNLQALSMRDRDDEADGTVDNTLLDKGVKETNDGFMARKWRRRHIENYLINPVTIARETGKTIQEVRDYFANTHALAIPGDVVQSDVPLAIRDARGKEIMTRGLESVEAMLNVDRDTIAKAMLPEEIPDDIKIFVATITTFCADLL